MQFFACVLYDPSISSCLLNYVYNNRCKADGTRLRITQMLLNFFTVHKSPSARKHIFIISYHRPEMFKTAITKACRLTPSTAYSIQLKKFKPVVLRYILMLFYARLRKCYFLVWFSGTKFNLIIFPLTYIYSLNSKCITRAQIMTCHCIFFFLFPCKLNFRRSKYSCQIFCCIRSF
jgi:hypothetical protein